MGNPLSQSFQRIIIAVSAVLIALGTFMFVPSAAHAAVEDTADIPRVSEIEINYSLFQPVAGMEIWDVDITDEVTLNVPDVPFKAHLYWAEEGSHTYAKGYFLTDTSYVLAIDIVLDDGYEFAYDDRSLLYTGTVDWPDKSDATPKIGTPQYVQILSKPVETQSDPIKWTSESSQTWLKGSKDGLTYSTSDYRDRFKFIYVNGRELDTKYYTVESAEDVGTVIKFKPDYLDVLSPGDHSFEIVAERSCMRGMITVEEPAAGDITGSNQNAVSTTSPKTGDNGVLALCVFMLALLGAATTGLRLRTENEE